MDMTGDYFPENWWAKLLCSNSFLMRFGGKFSVALEPGLASCLVTGYPCVAKQSESDGQDDNAADEEAVPAEGFRCIDQLRRQRSQ